MTDSGTGVAMATLGQIGDPIERCDGIVKVSGRLRYTGDLRLPGMVHAVAVTSGIALGSAELTDLAQVRAAPGVLYVLTAENMPRLKPLPADGPVRAGQSHLVLQDDEIRYYGQYLAVVIAETLEQAEHAASLLRLRYRAARPVLRLEDALETAVTPAAILLINPPAVDAVRGDPEWACATAPVRVDLRYSTPRQTHNPMEPHCSVAMWHGDQLLLFEATQWVMGARSMVAAHLGMRADNVRVISASIGGGFGAKGVPWPHSTLAAVAASRVGRPVKLVLSRQQMFGQTGHRPGTLQRLRIGAGTDGRLLGLSHETVSDTSRFDDFVEAGGQATRVVYSCPNLASTHRIVRVDLNSPSPMRGPGEATGSFALESAIDELAYAVGLDPLEVRLRNYAEADEETGKPFSSKSLRECYEQAAARFGWPRRPAAVRSMRNGSEWIGWGMATAAFPVKLSAASAQVQMRSDGTVIAASATHELGTGTYTALAQIVADTLGVPFLDVQVILGDTTLPEAPSSAGSQTLASVGSALVLAARDLRRQLIEQAVGDSRGPLFGLAADRVEIAGGILHARDEPSRRDSWREILGRRPSNQPLQAAARWSPPPRGARPWSGWSFGAHFCEVRVDADLGTVRLERWVAGFAAGRIINPRTSLSQLKGGIIWGIGQALREETLYDPASGIIVNDDLADYHLPVNADIPPIDVFLLEERDELINPLGAKGVGELGICGAAAAIANAVYHATGVRLRDLPIKLDGLLRTT
jgi:xanthine dehydrogenase YagR molybdenum-binding subunit